MVQSEDVANHKKVYSKVDSEYSGLPGCRCHRLLVYAKRHSDLVCDTAKTIFQSTELAVCPGMDTAIYTHGCSRVSDVAQGVGEPTGQNSANCISDTANTEYFVVGSFLRSSVSPVRTDRYLSFVGGYFGYCYKIFQATGGQCAHVALFAVGNFCRGLERLDIGAKPIGGGAD
jgi:hypothetical protein